jgi:hypothetical protein
MNSARTRFGAERPGRSNGLYVGFNSTNKGLNSLITEGLHRHL